VKAASRLSDPRVVERFAWTRAACDAHGLGFEGTAGRCNSRCQQDFAVSYAAGHDEPLQSADTITI
jgi:hypothetical protein